MVSSFWIFETPSAEIFGGIVNNLGASIFVNTFVFQRFWLGELKVCEAHFFEYGFKVFIGFNGVLDATKLEPAVIVKVKESRIALGEALARKIMI